MGFVIFDAGAVRPYPLPKAERPAVSSVTPVAGAAAVGRGVVETPSDPTRAVAQAYARASSPPAKQRTRARTVGQIMSSPVKILYPDTTVASAQAICREHGFRHLPVQTVSKTLAGIVSDRDLLAVPADKRDKWVLHVMTKRVLTATPDTELREVAEAMTSQRVSALPIMNDARQIVGIVTVSDLLRCIVNEAPLDLWV